VRRVRLTVAATLAASLFLAGCGGDDGGNKDEQSGGPKGVGEGASLTSTWPLTGLDVGSGKSSETTHPVYIVKIDNASASDPQVGLGDADLVVEELVEGGITRLAAFFHSQLPGKVGPVRSMRLTDIGIAKPADAQIVTSGAAGITLRGLAKAGVKYIDMSNPNITRDSSSGHDYLHSVMADLAAIGKEAKGEPARPGDYLPWGDAKDFPRGQKAATVNAKMSAGRTSTWQYAGGKYTLQNSYMPESDQFKADTVIAITVKTSIAPYTDPAGNPVPVSHFEGSGKAVIFHGGRMVRATWKKAKEDSAVTFSTKAGDLKVPAGRTWIELVPADGGAVTFS
jgi:hypothetical protein